jgi:vacuolar-type H+-ATPase subunit E/Vma4
MGATELLEKIRLDGRARVAAVEAERNRTLGEVEARTRSEVAAIEAEGRARGSREATAIVERAQSSARLVKRNAVLAARWEVMDRVAGLARERVLADPDYPAMVCRLVKRHAGPDSVARLSEQDTLRFGGKVGATLGKPAAIAGGVLIEAGRQQMSFSLSDTLAAGRDEEAARLSEILFAGDV